MFLHEPAWENPSESFEAMLAHIPGLRVVIPSSPATAYGLLLAAHDWSVTFVAADVVVNGSAAIGLDAINGENFGFDSAHRAAGRTLKTEGSPEKD